MNKLAQVLSKLDEKETKNSITAHKIPSGVAGAARKGLAMRKEFGRGGTDVGINRAKQLSTKDSVSSADLKQIFSYFSRHIVDKQGKDWDNKDKPSKGRIANLLWGGEAGEKWSKKERAKIK